MTIFLNYLDVISCEKSPSIAITFDVTDLAGQKPSFKGNGCDADFRCCIFKI